MQDLTAGDLTITVTSRAPERELCCVWRGKSNARDPRQILGPWFGQLLKEASGSQAAVEMHFEDLEHFNSSTMTALIRLIQDARKSGVRLVMTYDQNVKWQRLGFEALRVFEKNDHLFQLRCAERGD
jgi:hypothetical protein